MTDYYFQADGTLSTSVPASEASPQTSYQVDPANPILTVGGNNLPPDIGGSIHCGPMDQSEVDKRDDVLLFQTPVLDEELPLTGGLYSTLYVSSDVIDTDFMVSPALPGSSSLTSLSPSLLAHRSRSLMSTPLVRQSLSKTMPFA
jgi:predicted acyl esterase